MKDTRQVQFSIATLHHLVQFREHREKAYRFIPMVCEIEQIFVNNGLQEFVNDFGLFPVNSVHPARNTADVLARIVLPHTFTVPETRIFVFIENVPDVVVQKKGKVRC